MRILIVTDQDALPGDEETALLDVLIYQGGADRFFISKDRVGFFRNYGPSPIAWHAIVAGLARAVGLAA